MGSYLGIPESLGGSKTQVFGFLQERLDTRVNIWTFKFFTKGGKRSDYKVSGYGFAKPCNVLFSYSEDGNEETNECRGTVLVEFMGVIREVGTGNHVINYVAPRRKEV